MNFIERAETQPETIKIVEPFIAYMRSQGWVCKNIHGNKFQKGLPDYVCFKNGRSVWVEFKQCAKSGNVSITQAQRVVFAEMSAHNIPAYVVGDYDLRGNKAAILVHYKRILFSEPNIGLTLDKRLHHLIPSGMVEFK